MPSTSATARRRPNLKFPSFKFHLNLIGEFNVRNALAVIACAKHCGLKNHQIQSAFDTFKGIKRRMEVRGIAGGVTVVDDFGHHPTAIRETLKALRLKYPREKIWAVFEPRSNTTRRNVFQSELAGAFADADAVVVSEVARLEQIAAGERLNPEKLMQDLKTAGKDAAYLPDVDSIVAHMAKNAQGGDIVCRLQQRRLRRDSRQTTRTAGQKGSLGTVSSHSRTADDP